MLFSVSRSKTIFIQFVLLKTNKLIPIHLSNEYTADNCFGSLLSMHGLNTSLEFFHKLMLLVWSSCKCLWSSRHLLPSMQSRRLL